MKKILSLTLVAIMLLSTLMLTSCDAALEMLQDYLNSQTKPETPTPPTDEIRYTITAEEWNAVLNSTNFSIDLPYSTIMKTETSMKGTTEDGVRYLVLKDGICYELASVDGEWIGREVENDGSLSILLGDFLDLRDLDFFGTFTFNEESNSYIFEENGEKAEFYFENGKLVRGDIGVGYTIHNVGLTVIDVPEYVVDDDVRHTITEEEWNAVVNSTNFTVEGPYNTIMKTETEAKISVEESEKYLVLRDEVYFEVASVDGEWVGTELENDGSLLTPLSSMIDLRDVDFFGMFTFNAESNSYILEENGEKAEFYFENGKLVRGDIGVGYIIRNVGLTVIDVPEFIIKNESDGTTEESPEIDDSFVDGENYPEE